ncbi:hypothetical protein HGB07_05880, partial [Candidatus Roizmanbacteria bacterium]|nr:hypothetical protein [Candidatus Roizmanbacteria bacterium]
MSNGDDTEDKEIIRCDEHVDILKNTLDTIEMPVHEKERCLDLITTVYARKKLHIACKYGDRDLSKSQYSILVKYKKLQLRDMILYWAAQYKMINYIIALFRQTLSLLRSGSRFKKNAAY